MQFEIVLAAVVTIFAASTLWFSRSKSIPKTLKDSCAGPAVLQYPTLDVLDTIVQDIVQVMKVVLINAWTFGNASKQKFFIIQEHLITSGRTIL